MAFTVPANGIAVATPQLRIFQLTQLEDDAIGTDTAFTWAGLVPALPNMTGTPYIVGFVEVTAAGTMPTAAATFSLSGISAAGFTASVTSVSPGATGIRHTFRVYLSSKMPFEL